MGDNGRNWFVYFYLEDPPDAIQVKLMNTNDFYTVLVKIPNSSAAVRPGPLMTSDTRLPFSDILPDMTQAPWKDVILVEENGWFGAQYRQSCHKKYLLVRA